MSTEDDLRAEREQRLLEQRRDERAAARQLLERMAARGRLTPGQTGQLLDMCGLVGEPDGAGVRPVLMAHVFNEPGSVLSAPGSGGYR